MSAVEYIRQCDVIMQEAKGIFQSSDSFPHLFSNNKHINNNLWNDRENIFCSLLALYRSQTRPVLCLNVIEIQLLNVVIFHFSRFSLLLHNRQFLYVLAMRVMDSVYRPLREK